MDFGEDYSSSYIYHIIRVLDNGSTVLDETMFEGILGFVIVRNIVSNEEE